MSFGKMNSFIEIISVDTVTDSEGFSVKRDNVLASVRAYKEERHGSKMWANLAAFSEATALFTFRKIPGLEITTKHIIVCDTGRYNIVSVENIKGKGMYIEALGAEVKPSG
jgi:head-tail adaptor